MNKKALGPVAGIVGAGGNVGAVLAAHFLFKGVAPADYGGQLLILGIVVTAISVLAFAVRFSPRAETAAGRDFHLVERESDAILVLGPHREAQASVLARR